MLLWAGGSLRQHMQAQQEVQALVQAAPAVPVQLMQTRQRLPWLPERKLVTLQLSERRLLQRCGG